jgi:hypothetical protein
MTFDLHSDGDFSFFMDISDFNKGPISIDLCKMTMMGTSRWTRNEQSGLFVDSHGIWQHQSDQRRAFIDP